jgi:hypothetical protein
MVKQSAFSQQGQAIQVSRAKGFGNLKQGVRGSSHAKGAKEAVSQQVQAIQVRRGKHCDALEL